MYKADPRLEEVYNLIISSHEEEEWHKVFPRPTILSTRIILFQWKFDFQQSKRCHMTKFGSPFLKNMFSLIFQDAGALELAALTNKVVVSKYLSMLHTIYGRDVNAPNKRGHTLLHLLARKGDDCAETLEALLKIGLVSEDGSRSQRLLRMDVLNEGKKTPLDVATACVDLFSTGKDRAIYSRVIDIFHNAIENEANEWELENSSHQQQQLTFQNNFWKLPLSCRKNASEKSLKWTKKVLRSDLYPKYFLMTFLFKVITLKVRNELLLRHLLQ